MSRDRAAGVDHRASLERRGESRPRICASLVRRDARRILKLRAVPVGTILNLRKKSLGLGVMKKKKHTEAALDPPGPLLQAGSLGSYSNVNPNISSRDRAAGVDHRARLERHFRDGCRGTPPNPQT